MFGLSLWAVTKTLGALIFFMGIVSTFAYDIMGIAVAPLSIEPWKVLILDVGKTFLNSQKAISSAVREFGENTSEEVRNYLILRIAGASFITFWLIKIVYSVMCWIMPSKDSDLGVKLMAILISMIIVYGISLATSIAIGEGIVYPYSGWIDLINNRQIIAEYITANYS